MIVDETRAPAEVEAEVEEENYFISMTDMLVGLIFIFVIILMYFALQYKQTTSDLTTANDTRTEILQNIQGYLKRQGLRVEIDTKMGILRLPNEVLFQSAKAEVDEAGVRALGHLAEGMMSILPCYTDGVSRPKGCPKSRHRIDAVYIEGHTDTDALVPSLRLKDNWDLSVVRATNTYRVLVSLRPDLARLCNDAGHRSLCQPILSVSGYGENRPIAINDDWESKSLNRRIDLRFLMSTPQSTRDRGLQIKIPEATK